MIFSLVALAVLGLVILAFVLEPVLRAKSSATVLDAAAMPRPEEELLDDEAVEFESSAAPETTAPTFPRAVGGGVEARPAGDAP